MIPGAALAEWIADDDAQKRSYKNVEACALAWSRHPLMAETERAIRALDRRSPDNLLAIARRFMDQGEAIDTLLNDFYAGCRADPFFRPPLLPVTQGIYNGLLLYHHPDLSIALGVTGLTTLADKKTSRTGPGSVNFTGYSMLMRFIQAGGATLSIWEAPPIPEDFSGDSAGQCRLVEMRPLHDGDEIEIDGRYQSFSIEHATNDIVYFQAVARGECAPVCVEYDADSHHFVGASGTDDAGARIQMMASLLRAMDRDDAVPVLGKILESCQFHTRWQVMREMLAMDAEQALPWLRRMAEDDHPEVRATARQTLALFFDGEDAQGARACRA